MAYTDISRKATNKYRKKFDIIQFRVPAGERQQIAEHAALHGESVNVFLNRAVKETMERDGSDTIDKTDDQ